MKRYLLLTIALYVVMAGSAFSQGLSIKSAELSLSIGETSFSNKSFTIGPPQSATPINGNMKLSSGKMYEAHINFYNSKRLGSEVLYGYQYGGVTFHRTTAPASSFGVPLQVHTLTLNVLYYPFSQLNSPWRPFVFLGGGATIYRPSSGGQRAPRPCLGNSPSRCEERPWERHWPGERRDKRTAGVIASVARRFRGADSVLMATIFGIMPPMPKPIKRLLINPGRTETGDVAISMIET